MRNILPRMRHLIPNQSTDVNSEIDDPLTDGLKFKFQTVQRYLSLQQQQRQKQKQHQGLKNDSIDDTDDETLESSSFDQVATLMALSTAISAQHEIDSLLNGITELETMLMQQEEPQGLQDNVQMNLNYDNPNNDINVLSANDNECRTDGTQNHYYSRRDR